jgi:aspartyl-tRNA(Asn)/glutamyl-tRNA(Gln) amidotransferase subunit A
VTRPARALPALRRRELLLGAAGAVVVAPAADARRRRGRRRRARWAAQDPRVTDAADLGVLEAAALLRARHLSSVELTRACLSRIDQRDGGAPSFDGAPGSINAWVRLYPELALARARAADRRLARRGGAPALCGIPIGVKDLYAIGGVPLTASSHVLDGYRAPRDCSAWRRLERAGMVPIGHTHTHEFGAGATTDQVGNPRHVDHIVGGSSGGSAAALAAGMVPAATGTDTGGSLRFPAAFCGVSAIKPSFGRVPLDGIVPVASSFDHAGPMARSVADCAVLLQAMAGRGLERLATQPRRGSSPLAGLVVAVTDRLSGTRFGAEVAAGFEGALLALGRLGATVVSRPAPPQATLADSQYGGTFSVDLWAFHQRYADRASLYRPPIAELVRTAAAEAPTVDYAAAREARLRVTAAWTAWFGAQGVHMIAEPTAPFLPPVRVGYGADYGMAGELLRSAPLWNATGFPVVALPAGLWGPVALPVGLSLIGPPGADAALVRAAVDLQERALPAPGIAGLRG